MEAVEDMKELEDGPVARTVRAIILRPTCLCERVCSRTRRPCLAHRKWTDATRSPHLFIHARPGADPDGVGREYD